MTLGYRLLTIRKHQAHFAVSPILVSSCVQRNQVVESLDRSKPVLAGKSVVNLSHLLLRLTPLMIRFTL